MKRRILTIALTIFLLVSMMPCTFAASFDNLTVTYTFDNETAGIADGDVVIGGISSDELALITDMGIYWGDASGAKLSGYDEIKTYYAAVDSSNTRTTNALLSGVYNSEKQSITYDISGSRYLPADAESLVVEINSSEGTVTKSVAIAETKRKLESEEKYNMFWISDFHANYESFVSTTQHYGIFNVINKFYEADKEKFKGVIINGDITNNGYYFQYNNMEYLIDNIVEEKYPVYYSIGNHDVAFEAGDTDTYDAMQFRFKKLADMGYTFDITDKWSYDTYIGGEHYIFLATPIDTSYALYDEQVQWLETKICESENAGIPTYVFSHMTVDGSNIPGSFDSNKMNPTASGVVFKDLLERHPNTIVVTSHVHNNLNNNRNTAPPTVMVNSGEVSYVCTSSCGDHTYDRDEWNTASVKAGANDRYGRFVQVYDDKVVIRSVNMSTANPGNWVPRAEYVIPINNANKFDGDVSVVYDNLETGSTVTAKLNNADIDTNAYDVEWFLNGTAAATSLGTGVTYTVAEANANKNVSVKVTDKANTAKYAWAATSYFTYKPESENTGGGSGGGSGSAGGGVGIQFANDNTVKFHNGIAKVTGQVAATYAGQKIMLVVSPKSNPGEVKYINEVVVGTDGTYSFKFKAGTITADDFLKAKIQGADVTNSIIAAKDNTEGEVALTLALDVTNQPVVTIQNNYYDVATTKLIIATYNQAGDLVDVVPMDYSLAFDKYGEIATYTGAAVTGTGNNVRVYMIDNYDNIRPLAKNVTPVAIPEIAAE